MIVEKEAKASGSHVGNDLDLPFMEVILGQLDKVSVVVVGGNIVGGDHCIR